MNISDSIKKLGIGVDKPVLDKSTATKASAKSTTGEVSTASDSVTLSSTSVQLQSDSSEVYDTQKVEEIKAAIARGDFSVDTGKVADGLMQSVKDLLQAKQG